MVGARRREPGSCSSHARWLCRAGAAVEFRLRTLWTVWSVEVRVFSRAPERARRGLRTSLAGPALYAVHETRCRRKRVVAFLSGLVQP